MELETNNEQAAKLLLSKLGKPAPNCYNCAFCGTLDPHHQYYRTCNSDIAKSIKAVGTEIRKILDNTNEPLFPILYMTVKDDEGVDHQEAMPGLIASEYGISVGLVAWPHQFDPIYILFCMFYASKQEWEDELHQENSL